VAACDSASSMPPLRRKLISASDACSLPEVVGDAGFTIGLDAEREMAGAIIATVIQENLAADLRKKAEEQAAKFSWEKTATETIVVYDQVLREVNGINGNEVVNST